MIDGCNCGDAFVASNQGHRTGCSRYRPMLGEDCTAEGRAVFPPPPESAAPPAELRLSEAMAVVAFLLPAGTSCTITSRHG